MEQQKSKLLSFIKRSVGIVSVLCVACLAFWLIKTGPKLSAQTNEKCNTNTPDSNSNKTNLLGQSCDFSQYNPLKTRSLPILSFPQPDYPKAAKEKKLSGCVPVKILVNKKGVVTKACSLGEGERERLKDCLNQTSDESLKTASEEAALKAKFKVSGIKIKDKEFFELVVTYNFVASDQ